MKFSEIIANVKSSPSPQNIKDLKQLGSDLAVILDRLKKENNDASIGYRNTIRQFGEFVELIMTYGIILKVPHLIKILGPKIELIGWNGSTRSVREPMSVLDLSFGTRASGGIDVLGRDPIAKVITAFSCKMKHLLAGKARMGEAEADRMEVIESKNNKELRDFSFKYFCVVPNRKDYKHKSSAPNLPGLLDMDDLRIIWFQDFANLKKIFFDWKQMDIMMSRGKETIELYYHQKKGIEKALAYYATGGESFLFDHVPRSGKTITALSLILQMKAKNVLLLTNFPSINQSEWFRNARKYLEFLNWNIIDMSADPSSISRFDPNGYNLICVSLQDLKSRGADGKYGVDKAKFGNLLKVRFDLVVEDEVHRAFETQKTRNVLEGLNFDKVLALSGTPMVNYVCGTFSNENTHHWGLLEERQYAKMKNPDGTLKYPYYADYPLLQFLVCRPDMSMYSQIRLDYTDEECFTMGKLFSVSDDKQSFRYDKDVDQFVQYIFSKPNGPFMRMRAKGMSGQIGNGILFFVPSVDSAKLMTEKLKANPFVKAVYGDRIDYTYADRYRGNSRAQQLLDRMNKLMCEGLPFIIVAVDQLTTGITISGVDTVIMANDCATPADYWQRSYRARTAVKAKKFAWVIDMNPSRHFDMSFSYAQYIANYSKRDTLAVLKELVNNIPVWLLSDSMRMLTANDEIEQIFHECMERSYNLFRSRNLLMEDKFDEEILELLSTVDIVKDGKEIRGMKNGIEKGKTEKRNGGNNRSHNGKDGKNKPAETSPWEKMLAILDNITWLCVFTRFQYNDWEKIFEAIKMT